MSDKRTVDTDCHLPKIAQAFLDDFRDGNRSNLTIYDYGNTYRRFFAEYTELTTANVRAFIAGHTPSTRGKYRNHLKALAKFSKADVDFDAIKPPKLSNEPPVVIPPEHQTMILNWMNRWNPVHHAGDVYPARVYAKVTKIILKTALRIAEVVELKPRDLKLDRHGKPYLHVRKVGGRSHSKEGRSIPIDQHTHKLITELGLPFKIVERTYNHYMALACTELEIPSYSAHNVRKTCATQWFDDGMDVKTIADLMGHTDLKTLLHYLDRSPESLRQRMNNAKQRQLAS